MRQITENACNALINKENFKSSNTKVFKNSSTGFWCMAYHNNIIAYISEGLGKLVITNCGYFTNTTKERLNGLPGVSIHQKAGVWYLNGEEWDGKEKEI